MRYYVGIDYGNYLNVYLNINYYISLLRYEPGFSLLTVICSYFDLHYIFYFGIIALIQIFFLLFSFRKRTDLMPYVVFVYMSCCVTILGWTNIMRQWIAMCLIIFAVSFVDINKFKKILLVELIVLIAFLFHYSSIVFLPLPILFYLHKGAFFKNKKYQFIFLFIFFSFQFFNAKEYLYDWFDNLVSNSEYSRYIDYVQESELTKFGLFSFFQFLIHIIIIKISDNMRYYYQDFPIFDYIYDLAIIGIYLNYLFGGSMMLTRITWYFYCFYYIIIAFAIKYLLYSRTNQIFLLSIIILFCSFSFVRIMLYMEENTSQYVFYFQTEQHAMKEIQRLNHESNIN